MAANRIGKVVLDKSLLFLCDMQEKFRPTVKYFAQIVEVSNRVLRTARHLDIPVIVTEQYPKGLGVTVAELGIESEKIIPKTQFSMMTPEIKEFLERHKDRNQVILCGIETQACIQQTALDLLENNYQVHIVVDASSSRSLVDRKYAFDRMKDAGAFLTTSESMILGLCRNAKHPKFRDIQKIIWDSAPDSGLLNPAQ
ncbi:isochorismatase domain-containing protein 2-like isoform X1 [Tubulanus polymorphus]|uniref:isochorismatase domain-containing protein 2-like isoform X1 n=1 Tax=Tubulanus polymorphus TaxID=672921 RepID=UPI003DA495EF